MEADVLGPESAVPYLTARHPGGRRTYVSCTALDAADFGPGSPLGVETAVREGEVTLTLRGLTDDEPVTYTITRAQPARPLVRVTRLSARALPLAVRP
ncbi:hypothetical protein ACFWP5_05005 [Streptomyces sp. NPDC058469]|uniref:hypothetical protein n=1 Tax=Streptomyces sp. NPDC058469 TaxID=3346514 RepID=UPI00365B9028